MPIIQDKEFGKITIRRSQMASQVKLRVAPDGTLHASLPIYAPTFLVKGLLNTSRDKIRQMLAQAKPEYSYSNGMQIGKSHTLIIQPSNNIDFSVSRHGQQIIVKMPQGESANSPIISRKIRDTIISALRIEAKSYLPRRLSFLADKFNFDYSKVKFSHASGRWGSCSSKGTISLNIALMKLPFELIDYIIIHELSHTKQMNHGKDFWSLVASADPKYKLHRHTLKKLNPSI
ncbi:MAG: SprT family zinc-dependent metalloprotease [Candidatus Saccharibacteria bacterium]